MRNPGRECRIQSVEIDRYINGPAQVRAPPFRPRSHVDDVRAEARRLFALVAGHRPNSDLDETQVRMLLENARERAGVREPVALELVVEVGMRVDLQDGESRDLARDRTHDRIRDRVVSADRHRTTTVCEDARDRMLDRRARLRWL